MRRTGRIACATGFLGGRGAARELESIVEEEEAGGGAGLDGEGGQGAVFVVELQHAAEIDGADDVDVVEKEGLGGICGGVRLLIIGWLG